MNKDNDYSRDKFEAYLGNYLNFWSYLNTYHNAFNALIDDVNKTKLHVDRIAYAMLFLVRHCLELGFKANIRYFQKYSERKEFTNSDSHILKNLFDGFKLHVTYTIKNLKDKFDIEVEQADKTEFAEYCKEVESLIDQFEIIDRTSINFRYPVDNNNNFVFKQGDKVNILDIKEVFDKAMVLLYHTSDVFAKYTDYADTIEQIYEEEMKRAYQEGMASAYVEAMRNSMGY